MSGGNSAAEEQLRDERVKVRMLEDKVKQMELDIEAIPILKAQVYSMYATTPMPREKTYAFPG